MAVSGLLLAACLFDSDPKKISGCNFFTGDPAEAGWALDSIVHIDDGKIFSRWDFRHKDGGLLDEAVLTDFISQSTQRQVYVHDSARHLSEIRKFTGGIQGETVFFKYDAQGDTIAKFRVLATGDTLEGQSRFFSKKGVVDSVIKFSTRSGDRPPRTQVIRRFFRDSLALLDSMIETTSTGIISRREIHTYEGTTLLSVETWTGESHGKILYSYDCSRGIRVERNINSSGIEFENLETRHDGQGLPVTELFTRTDLQFEFRYYWSKK